MGIKPAAGMPIKFVGEIDGTSDFHLNPGELALLLSFYPLPHFDIVRAWWLRCPCGSGGMLDDHTVNSTDPVDITPSIVCPSGCHYFIRGGVIV